MRNTVSALLLCVVLASSASAAEEPEELLVTTIRTDKTVIPGASLTRPADFALQRLKISNDAPDEKVRKQEILETLRQMESAAAKDSTIELALLVDYRTVVPLKSDIAALKLTRGSRSDTSELVVCIKTRVPAGIGNRVALFDKLKGFANAFRPVGRSAVDLLGDVDVTIVNASQYREQVIRLYAADSRLVTSALGEDYRVVTQGIDRQLQWMRDGLLNVLLYIPYEYDVIPASVASYSPRDAVAAPGRPANPQN